MTVTAGVAAFYTPLKHPFQTEASGDRQIAWHLLDGLGAMGFRSEVASRLATWQRRFDSTDAVRLERAAALVAQRVLRRYRRRPPAERPRVWMTYQNYYRCPDLLGPAVSTALGIPYVLVAPAVSRSSRRTAFRPWVSAVRLAIRRADLVFAMSPRDLPGLARLRGEAFAALRTVLLPPAVDLRLFAASTAARAAARATVAGCFPGGQGPVCLTVAMMRVADKLDSYRLLADALGRLLADREAPPWRLLVVGDGPARSAVEQALGPLPADRVCLLGAVEPKALPAYYLGADLFAFPGIGEDAGLVYLEAAAAGLPVVACHGPGPSYMVAPGGGLLTAPTTEAFAEALRTLLEKSEERRRMGETGRRFVETERSLEVFRDRLRQGFRRVGLS